MVKSVRLVRERDSRRKRAGGRRVAGRAKQGDLVRHPRTAQRLAERLNAAADYEAFCAAELARFPRDLALRARAQREMRRPESAWRKTYAAVKVVEGVLLESLDLLSNGILTTDAMRRFNAFAEREQALIPMLGQEDRKYGGVLALSNTERFIPDAPTVARLVPGSGGEPSAELWDVVATGYLARFKRCPQCKRWFVDESKNRTGVRCSAACTNKWWTRARRRANGHRRPRR